MGHDMQVRNAFAVLPAVLLNVQLRLEEVGPVGGVHRRLQPCRATLHQRIVDGYQDGRQLVTNGVLKLDGLMDNIR